MKTFGQRVRDLRKKMDISQLELSDKLGVSVQTISRWECDAGMPDIVQIVPLAKVLETTTDMLLGMNASETDDIDRFEAEMAEFWDKTTFNNANAGERYEDKVFAAYKKCHELYKKYPTNFNLVMQCSRYGIDTLEMARRLHRLTLDEKDAKSVYRETQKMLSFIVNYDPDLQKKLEAKKMLINLHCNMGEWEKAEHECDGFEGTHHLDAKMNIALARGEEEDRENMISFAKKNLDIKINDLSNAFYTMARAYAIFGKPKRAETVAVLTKTLEVFATLEGAMDERSLNWVRNGTAMLFAKEYLREGDIEKCLTYVEDVTDNCIAVFQSDKKAMLEGIPEGIFCEGAAPEEKSEEERKEYLSKLKRDLMWMIVACWEECGSEDNPITQSERYKICIEKYNREMVVE